LDGLLSFINHIPHWALLMEVCIETILIYDGGDDPYLWAKHTCSLQGQIIHDNLLTTIPVP